MATKRGRGEDSLELGGLIDEIIADAYGDDEQLWAFRQVFEDNVVVPAEAFVVGEPVTVMTIDYDGNERRGLTARCRREEGSEQAIAACDLIFPEGSAAARYMATYRTWLGIEPHVQVSFSKTRRRPPKATEYDFDMTQDVELIAVIINPHDRHRFSDHKSLCGHYHIVCKGLPQRPELFIVAVCIGNDFVDQSVQFWRIFTPSMFCGH